MVYNYIIVGSGVAGATVAKNLLESNPRSRILIIEAGPKVKMQDRRLWWDYVVSGDHPYDHCEDLSISDGENSSTGGTPWTFKESRLMGHGGSTVHWGGWSLRFKPEDFELYSRTGRGADWPISYSDLERYYCKAEEFLSVGGSQSDKYVPRSKPYPLDPFPFTDSEGLMMQSFDRLGITYTAMPVARYAHCVTTGTCKYCPFGARFSASLILDRIAANHEFPNFSIITGVVATRLLQDSRSEISALEYTTNSTGEIKTVKAEKYIICSGAYETPKLLLASQNSYWNNGIANDNDLVGRFLISHPFLFVRGESRINEGKMQQEVDFPILMSRHYDTPEEQSSGKLFLFKSRSRPRIKLANLMSEGVTVEQLRELSGGKMEIELQGFMEEFSNFNNRVTVGVGTNRFGLPQTDVHFTRNSDFEGRAQQRLSLMKEVLMDMGLNVTGAGVRPQRGDHAASTCRMSECPENGIVDKNLKLHELDNLYACSNAVFPSGSAVNPTLTLTALAIRLAEHLGEISA